MPPPTSSTPRARTAHARLDSVLVTKIHAPHAPPGYVARPRLIDLLDQGTEQELTLVCAPAGFGKTALIADWIRRRDQATAWLGLDPGDNDPVRFWRHAVAALDRVRPGIAAEAAPMLGAPAPRSFDDLVAAVVNVVAADAGEVVLVLDDYHLIDADPVHASMQYLISHAPPQLHLTVTSRADPPLALARLRARRQLAEVRADDLRFTEAEAATLLHVATGVELAGADVATLIARTEGWVAGLQLAGLSLQGRADVSEFVATFSGSHRYVLDYLTEEVLESQPGHVREFLLETSILDRLSGPLCDAVTGRADGQEMLEATEAANLFVVPLDDERGWWRYHHLFADLLRSRLQRCEPERVRQLHRAAAAWHSAHDLVDAAVGHLVSAGDLDQAARLITDEFDVFFRAGEQATIARWLSLLPSAVVRSHPRLCTARGWVGLVTSDLEVIDETLAVAEAIDVSAVDHSFQPSVGVDASLLANVPVAIALVRSMAARASGDFHATEVFAGEALAACGESGQIIEVVARQQLAVARSISGEITDAERSLTDLVSTWQEAGEPVLTAWATQSLGPVRRAQGRLSAALESYEDLLTLATGAEQPGGLVGEGIAHMGMGEIAYDRGDLAGSMHHLTEGISRCRKLNYGRLVALGLTRMAWIHHARNARDRARDLLQEAGRPISTHGPIELTDVPALRARLLLALGDTDQVARWTEERGLDVDDEPSFPREAEHLVLARLLITRGEARGALGLLDRLRAAATAQRRTASTIEILTLRAAALAAQDEPDAAVTALAEALVLGHPEGHVRVFVDEGEPIAGLVARLASRRDEAGDVAVPASFLAGLADEFDEVREQRSVPGGAANAELVVPLTERECDVLRMLAEGRSNQAIADALYLALNTVKHHVTHILDKLGAANRTEAVARARDHGLIP